MKKLLTSCALIALVTAGLIGAAHAQTSAPNVPDHPRDNEVDQRLSNQQNRTDAGAQSGQVNAKQESRDTTRDSRVSGELSRDEAKDNGHITKAQKAHMNKQLSNNSKHIHNQRTDGSAKPAAPSAPAALSQ